jgi:hypothetical protein
MLRGVATSRDHRSNHHREMVVEIPQRGAGHRFGQANLVVIDADRHGDTDGVANFAKLIEGHDLPVVPIINTAGGGKHYVFRQPESGEPLGNRTGDLPDRIDVRENGGFVIAVGAVRPDGVAYESEQGSPDLAEAFKKGSIPVLPEFLERVIRPKRVLASPRSIDASI